MIFPPYGTLELTAHHGSDLDIVNAARVSFAKHSEVYSDEDGKVLRFLMRERHGTPFEHNYFKWHLRAPMVVWWELVRHRIASYNLESGRYVQLRPHFYYPEKARVQVGRPGAYKFQDGDEDQTEWLQQELEEFSENAFNKYLHAIDKGIAKEQARLFIPTNLYVEGFMSCNARSLMNFLNLRNDDSAMYEIRRYAEVMEDEWAKIMPDTAEAFREFGRMAP